MAEQGVLLELGGSGCQERAEGEENRPEAVGKPRLKGVNRNQLLMRTVDVEKLIPQDHPARGIWAMVEQLDMTPFETSIKAVEGHAGQSTLDRRVLTTLWIYANSEAVSSARELSRMIEYEPGCQWITGMTSINYHTLADFRMEQKEALNKLFVQVLGVLSADGLIELKQVTQDGTKVKANAAAGTFRREQRLKEHLELAQKQVEQFSDPKSEELSQRAAKARQRAAKEKKEKLELALAELEKLRKEKAPDEREDARVSTSDPEARKMKQNDGGYAPSYNVQLSTDVAHGIIIAVGLSQDRHDGDQLVPAIQEIQRNIGQLPAQVIADGAYTQNTNIDATAEQGIELVGPAGEDQTTRSCEKRGVGREFYPDAFRYESATDIYLCPTGHTLHLKQSRYRSGRTEHNYLANPADCQACPFLQQCCPKARARWITRIEDSPAVIAFRKKMRTEEAQNIYKKRKQVAEFPNAWLKDKIGLRQFRLRGLVKVRTQTVWACLTYNIQQWIRLRWRSQFVVAVA
jgi:transposase